MGEVRVLMSCGAQSRGTGLRGHTASQQEDQDWGSDKLWIRSAQVATGLSGGSAGVSALDRTGAQCGSVDNNFL